MRAKYKKELGQFFTVSDYWIQPQIISFIEEINKQNVLDPFAGGGDLLRECERFNFKNYYGLDKDTSLGWKYKDSLISKLNLTISEILKETGGGLILLPFKSSNRRRMTLEQAKGIVEKVILDEINIKENDLWIRD